MFDYEYLPISSGDEQHHPDLHRYLSPASR